ncbi:MAG: thioredoxin [Oscillospiraceae bacterium]|nr:thioredoxin [Oscillospiraceae bacterium]
MSAIEITEQNFNSEVLTGGQTVLLDFWAPWCGPCRMMSPVIDQVAEKHPEVKVGKINVDEQPNLAARFSVMSIPTLAVIKNGKTQATSVGVKPMEAVEAML